ncbi:MAG: adenylosuccinate lyase [Flavobacteriales bacterium]|nr:adenylosuccinate lyase [Flavobacteriales bacterium]
MEINVLNAVSPLDGRYARHTTDLSAYFSEAALIRYRVRVEMEYFIALCKLPLPQLRSIDHSVFPALRSIYLDFKEADAARVKVLEQTTNHDVKAVEYLIKEKLDALGVGEIKEFVHFGLTSQDINNTATPLMMKEATTEVYLPLLNDLLDTLRRLATDWMDIPLLARTHGQPASPTRLGKEVLVFVERLDAQIQQLKAVPYSAKFGGATGNFNAHHVAYPDIDWTAFANDFVNGTLGLQRSQTTTQIEHYDNIAAWCDALRRINTIILDLDRDFWMYVMNDLFKQRIKEGEVGSSAMPHKVNPIDFENSEGNLGLANALLGHLAEKLPVSRLQRDLTDSTVLRNLGVPVGYTLIALRSTLRGLSKLLVNKERIHLELENNWVVVAEGIQTVLRREGYPKPYEALKEFSRTNAKLDKDAMLAFIESLSVSELVKAELRAITPFNYLGMAPKMDS